MGFQIQNLQKKTDQEKDLQKYYSQLYRETVQKHKNEEYIIEQVVCSIFTRTKVPTKTYSNRQLALLDIDKIISFNQSSLDERGDRVKYMRMVSGLMQQSQRVNASPNRQIQHLVRMARLHLLSQNRNEQQEQQ